MKVIYGIGKAKHRYERAVLTIGVFDGVHIGHQKLIADAVLRARRANGKAVVMTFDPHPIKVLKPEIYLPYITSLNQRLELIKELGVDVGIVVEFDHAFAALSPDEFVQTYLVEHIKPIDIVVGSEFCFGRNRSGTIDYLKDAGRQHGFKVSPMVPVKGDESKIGSTGIRRLIASGDLALAERYLGRRISVQGVVSQGDGRGRTLGYPTANINVNGVLLPPMGVYATLIHVSGRCLPSMSNIGRRPSFKKDSQGISLEVCIFDFDENIYNEAVTVEFVEKIRDEQTFSSEAALIAQIGRDESKIRQILCSNQPSS